MADRDRTVFDPGTTVPESSKTVLESSAAVLDGGTMDAALSDAAGLEGPTISNAAIRKGSTILDTYRVESNAIEGGMGAVWRVYHTGWNVDLAMKRPKAGMFQTEMQKENFIRECDAWIKLGLHPHIVSCYYVRRIGDIPTIFSEWMDGGSLKNAIDDGRLYEGKAAERILDIAIQFARGLHYAHEAGLIHQDVKPDNVLLTKEGEAKVADFGLARARAVLTVLEGDPSMRETNGGGRTILSPSGGYTPAYCSMEQMDGRELTRRTDIYSWAVSVMEMYLGDRPWANGVVAGVGCRTYFESTRVAMPDSMKELLAQCLDGEPENRPHDFEEIESKLHGIYQAETGSGYPRPESKAAADTADSLNNRALSFLDLGKPDKAEKTWERALAADPRHISSAYNQALTRWRKGKLTDAGALEAVRHASAGDSDDAAKYAQALLHMERGAGNDALQLLESCRSGEKDITAVMAQAQQIGHPMLAYTLKGTLFRHYRYPERDAHVEYIAFSECGKYVYARDYADVIEEEPDRGHINFWRLAGTGGVALGGRDPEIQQVRWQRKKSFGPPVESNGLNYMIALPSGKSGGEWYVQNSEGRILYTNFREVTGRPYGCLDINVDHTLVACGSHDSNDVDIYHVPKTSYVAPWLPCKVRSQRELSTQDDRFMELSSEVNQKLSIKEPAQALACLGELQPLVNAANQTEYRRMNAEVGRFCRPTLLRAIYSNSLCSSEPEAQFGFHAEYTSVFVERRQGKFLWEDTRRKKSNAPAAVSPDQALLVYTVYEGNHWFLIAADPLSGVERNMLKLTETPGDICFFPDGHSFLIALCETISVMKINAKTFKIENSFSGRKSRLTEKVFVCINHAGTHFVYGRLGDSHAGKGVDHEALTFCSVRDNNAFHTKDGLIGFEDYISDALFSEYDRWLLTKHFDNTVRIWETATGRCIQRFAAPETLRAIVSEGRIDWEYNFPGFADWDESARPYLEIFLALHPDWTEADFQNLILDLQNRGYGWLRPGGVRAKLSEMGLSVQKTKHGLFGKRK